MTAVAFAISTALVSSKGSLLSDTLEDDDTSSLSSAGVSSIVVAPVVVSTLLSKDSSESDRLDVDEMSLIACSAAAMVVSISDAL